MKEDREEEERREMRDERRQKIKSHNIYDEKK